jgi:hypothetical protein
LLYGVNGEITRMQGITQFTVNPAILSDLADIRQGLIDGMNAIDPV